MAQLYAQYRQPAATLNNNFSGFVFFYTQDYRYRTGQGYQNGRRLPGNMQLVRADSAPAATAATAGCTTYRIISYDPPYNVTVCQDQPDFGPLDPSEPGFFDPGYSGPTGSPFDPGSGPNPTGSTSINNTVNITLGGVRPCVGQVVINVQSMANSSILNGGPVAQLIASIAANSIHQGYN